MSETELTSSLKLAAALRDAGWHDLAERAAKGEFSDFDGSYAYPQHELVKAIQGRHPIGKVHEITRRVINGDFDATKEEADAWWKREGKKFCEDAGLPNEIFERPSPPKSSNGSDGE